jgi:protein-S-isoprenylcysteine O-methyltransferase Ste14
MIIQFASLPDCSLAKRRKKGNTLNTTGLNSLVRHPIYFGTLVALVGYLLYSFTFSTLIFVIIAIVYLFVESIFEEQKLIRTYRKAYRDHQKKVPRIYSMVYKMNEKKVIALCDRCHVSITNTTLSLWSRSVPAITRF